MPKEGRVDILFFLGGSFMEMDPFSLLQFRRQKEIQKRKGRCPTKIYHRGGVSASSGSCIMQQSSASVSRVMNLPRELLVHHLNRTRRISVIQCLFSGWLLSGDSLFVQISILQRCTHTLRRGMFTKKENTRQRFVRASKSQINSPPPQRKKNDQQTQKHAHKNTRTNIFFPQNLRFYPEATRPKASVTLHWHLCKKYAEFDTHKCVVAFCSFSTHHSLISGENMQFLWLLIMKEWL